MNVLQRFGKAMAMAAIFLGLVWGVICPTSALAQAPGPGDINDCDDCQNLVNVDVNGDGWVTTADLLIVYRDYLNNNYTAASDVNSDGVVNMDDYLIVNRCLGCSVCSSPFQ